MRTWPSQPYRTRARTISIGKVLVKPRMTNSHVRERMTAGISPRSTHGPPRPCTGPSPRRRRVVVAKASILQPHQRVHMTCAVHNHHGSQPQREPGGRTRQRQDKPVKYPSPDLEGPVRRPGTDHRSLQLAPSPTSAARRAWPPCGSIPRASVRLPRPARRAASLAQRTV